MAKKSVSVPSVGESITEVTIGSMLVKEGGRVNVDDPIMEIESDKASVEVLATESGTVHFTVKEGDTVSVGDNVAEIDTEGKVEEKPQEEKREPEKEAPQKEESKEKEPKKEAEVEKAAAEKAEGARISSEDYLKSVTEKREEKPAEKKPKSEEPKKPSSGDQPSGEVERKKMSKLRKTIASRLVAVKQETAMLTTFNEVDMSAIMQIRSREKEAFLERHGVKLTFLPFFIKAAIKALQKFPDVNAYIEGDEIVQYKHQHIGIAVSTDTGLVVPVIKNADQMSFVEITKAITEYAKKARDRKITISDMSGGSFTITNGGVFGSMLSTPILNPPQSAILGMHNIVERPVAINKNVEIRPIMYLALSYDHRIVDGKESVQFLVTMKEYLEDPTKFILED